MLLAGFSEGLYTPDIAVMLGEDLGMLMMYLGDQAGIEYNVTDDDNTDQVEKALESITDFKDKKMEFDKYNMQVDTPEEMPMENTEAPAPAGLMAKQETI